MVRPAVDWEGLSVCLLAVAVYINTLGHGFVYDDNRAILSNPDVQASSSLINVFHNDFWGTPLSSSNSHGSYRPLCVLSFRLNHWISGYQPFGFHLTNVLLHCLATALVLKTARVFLPGRSPTLTAALFAVHPVHVEAVAGVVGRADVLSSIFYLLSFLFYVEHVKVRDDISTPKAPFVKDFQKNKTSTKHSELPRKSIGTMFTLKVNYFDKKIQVFPSGERTYFSLFLVFAVCSMLSKEPGITVIPLAICYDIILHLHSKRLTKLKNFINASASASLTSFIAILLVRLYLMGLHTPTFSKADNPTAKDSSTLTRTLTFLYLPVFNFILLVCPRWLSFDWSMDAISRVTSVFDFRFLLSLGFYYLLYRATRSAMILTKVKRSKSFSKPQNCKVCKNLSTEEHLTTCTMVNNNNLPLHCNCLNPSNQPLSTGSTVTMCLAFVVLPFIPASNLFFYVGFVVAERVLYIPSMGFCLLVALGAHVLWASHRSLVLAGSLLVVAALGARTLQRNKDWNSEEALYRSATHINPPKAYGNLGSILGSAGRLEEAEAALRTALEYRPNMADVHYNLGNLQIRQHKTQEAAISYQLAIQYRPSLAVAHLNLGQVLEALERWQEAEVVYRKCSHLEVTGLKDPRSHEEARTSCVHQLSRICRRFKCQSDTLQAVESNNAKISKKKAPTEAEFSKVSNSKHVQPSISYAKLVGKNKTRTSEAEELFLRALERAPTDPAVYVNYGQLLVGAGRHSEAASLYLKAAQLAPKQHALVTSAAIALRHAGRLAEAEALYHQARDLRPMDATTHSNLGAIYHLQGKYRQAASSYREALRLAPGDQVTITNLQRLRNLLARNKR